MRLQYLGHSAFRLISDMGTTIVTDPYSAQWTGFEMTPVRCDAVTVSHHHGDHDCLDNILGNPAVLDREGECVADDIAIKSIATFHDDVKGAKRGADLVFTFETDGIRVVHLGDIGFVDPAVIERIRGCDVLLVPVGGTYTVDAVAAKRIVDEVKPAIVVPMHYKTAEHTLDIAGPEAFLELFAPDAVSSCGDTLTLVDKPAAGPKVVLLSRFTD